MSNNTKTARYRKHQRFDCGAGTAQRVGRRESACHRYKMLLGFLASARLIILHTTTIRTSLLHVLVEEVNEIEHAALVAPREFSVRAVDILHAVLLVVAGELVIVPASQNISITFSCDGYEPGGQTGTTILKPR